MRSFGELKKAFNSMFPAIVSFIKGFFLLLISEAPKQLLDTFTKHWKRSKKLSEKIATLCAGFIIASFLLYGFWGLWKDLNHWLHSAWYEQVVFTTYEQEVKDFYKKYNERFLAHDCDFMREVGADEAMFDKWNTTIYPKDRYSCEEFRIFQEKYIIPIEIEPIQRTGNKQRVKGEAIVIKINQGEPWKIESMYFDLWKEAGWELWHMNNPKDGPRKIPIEIDN